MVDRHDDGTGTSRRGALECMLWAGTGVVWTLAGGIPRSTRLAEAATLDTPKTFSFLQLSDSHVGFSKPANPNALGTLQEAVSRIKALPHAPSFFLHTGDISHLSRDAEFDDADQVLKGLNAPIFYVPGEHDLLDDGQGKAYLARYGRGSHGAGWSSFDQEGVHFVGLVNVVDLKAGGLGNLGAEQLAWLEDDLKNLSASTPVVVFAHIPLWTIYPAWGWGTQDSAQALGLLKRFGSVTVLNGHIHQVMQKVEGHVAFHTARSTAFPQPEPGKAPSPGPMKVPDADLRKFLGITEVSFVQGNQPLAILDTPLAG